jgi:hypothetical protein
LKTSYEVRNQQTLKTLTLCFTDLSPHTDRSLDFSREDPRTFAIKAIGSVVAVSGGWGRGGLSSRAGGEEKVGKEEEDVERYLCVGFVGVDGGRGRGTTVGNLGCGKEEAAGTGQELQQPE